MSPPSFRENLESVKVTDIYTRLRNEIPMLAPSTPTKILGVWMQPDNNQHRQLAYMDEKLQSWVRSVGSSHFPPYNKILSFKTILSAHLDYASSIVLMENKHFHDLFKPFLPVLKHSIGLVKMYPTDLIYLASSYGGYGIQNLWLRSLSTKMEKIVKHVRLNDFVGKKIRIMIEQHQFESGMSHNISQVSKSKSRQIIAPLILTYLGNQLGDLGISLNIDLELFKGPTLMDTLIDSSFTIEQFQRINEVRLQKRFIYWYPEPEGKYIWPHRDVSKKEKDLFESELRSFRTSSSLSKRYHFPSSLNKTSRLTAHHSKTRLGKDIFAQLATAQRKK